MAHPIGPPPVGSFRFNTETNMMEYYNGNEWMNITSTSPDVHTGGTRGFSAGGSTAHPGATPYTAAIDYFNVSTTGNAADFGDMTTTRGQAQSNSDVHGGLG